MASLVVIWGNEPNYRAACACLWINEIFLQPVYVSSWSKDVQVSLQWRMAQPLTSKENPIDVVVTTKLSMEDI